jgi:hypothetical protein
VRYGGREVSTLDLFDGRFTVLTGPAGTRWRSAADALADAGLPVVALSAGLDLADDGTLARRYGLGDRGAVLVRPDGHCGPALAAVDAGHVRALSAAVDAILGYPRVPALAVA